ncbi:hypothetical protein PR202_gb08170 [Eleusine coracana subsp. coracana]|uniref:Rubisco accumulation factor 1 helix turn helix domain-containing protein n=1 Tax=Eleusine coracana subsp. coracana TaxID=191504 RepID=A0AAV5EEG4_ELECO|nr:hypothetical protein PR202_gb08170 [Eleusine coracana subsp. coracana]
MYRCMNPTRPPPPRRATAIPVPSTPPPPRPAAAARATSPRAPILLPKLRQRQQQRRRPGQARGRGRRWRPEASLHPSPAGSPGQLYQPFHPPPSPLPEAYRDLDLTQRLAVLRDRLGQWYEYAPLIAALNRDGFMPSSIEEATGISGVEQNRLVVAAQVRDSLLDESAAFPPDLVSSFDAAPELLYELRFLTARQRADAARHALAPGSTPAARATWRGP